MIANSTSKEEAFALCKQSDVAPLLPCSCCHVWFWCAWLNLWTLPTHIKPSVNYSSPRSTCCRTLCLKSVFCPHSEHFCISGKTNKLKNRFCKLFIKQKTDPILPERFHLTNSGAQTLFLMHHFSVTYRCDRRVLTAVCLRFVLSASDVVSLDDSSLVFRLSPRPRRTSSDVVTLKFKTLRNSGTLLHAKGEGELGLSLELERGKLQLLLRQGTTHQMMHILISTDRYWYVLAQNTEWTSVTHKMKKSF